MYSMFSTPLTCSSIGRATVSTSTRALAPGYRAVTWTVGGVIGGYCATGSCSSATAPIRIISRASTLARTGRSMKYLENMADGAALTLRGRLARGRGRGARRAVRACGCLRGRSGHGGGRRRLLRCHLAAGDGTLDALDHHPVVGTHALLDHPHAVNQRTDLHRTLLDDIVLLHDQRVVALLVDSERTIRDQERIVDRADRHPHPHKQPG